MISIHDQALPPELFAELQKYAQETQFTIVEKGDKKFSVLPTPDYVLPYLEMPGHEIILTFIREATPSFNTSPSIHCDSIIEGRKPSFAAVLYLNETDTVSPNGTAFFSHWKHGYFAPDDLSPEEFDRLLIEDADDKTQWLKLDYISARPNRILVYPSNYFHAKFPAKIDFGVRRVLVAFYTRINT